MGRSSRSVVSSRALGVCDEAAEAWDHLVAAVLEGATDVGERSRRAGATARDRAVSAVQALRGQRRPAAWPWLVAGLGVGLMVGAVAGAVLARRKPERTALTADAEVGVSGDEPAPPVGES
jgi:hypothetical protein